MVILIFIGLLPLIVVDAPQLGLQYEYWYHLLTNDYNQSIGLSVAGFINSWTNLNVNKSTVLALELFYSFCHFLK